MSDFQIPFLSSLVGILAEVMRVCLEFCYKMTEDLGFPSYGIAIIVLTVIIKTLLLPLALKQIRSMKAMQAIQPEMQKIQKKYKNDPQKLREEMGKLYKENGASPLSGCLPLLIQMPFLISIYYALRAFPMIRPTRASCGWKAWLYRMRPTFFPILSAASTFIISWQTTPKDAPSNQKTMLLMMPVMIGWMSPELPERPCHLLDRLQPLPARPADHHVLGRNEGTHRRQSSQRNTHRSWREPAESGSEEEKDHP